MLNIIGMSIEDVKREISNNRFNVKIIGSGKKVID